MDTREKDEMIKVLKVRAQEKLEPIKKLLDSYLICLSLLEEYGRIK